MDDLTADQLIEGCRDDALDAGLTITAALEPIGGVGAPVKPPIYAPAFGETGAQYQMVRHWRDSDDIEPTLGILIDNVPSQANRGDAELARIAEARGLPEITLDLTDLEPLPAHVPRRISSYRFPHRVADSYLRDSVLDGAPMTKTEIGRALFGATADAPLPLLQWFPTAPARGYWQSHLGKGRSQSKLARSWTSQIVGYQPALAKDDNGQMRTPRVRGLKGDPLNLSVDEAVVVNPTNRADWELGKSKSGQATEKTKLSELGHGQVPFSANDTAPAAVSFHSIEQRATLSVAGLRRIWVGAPEQNALARAVAGAIVILAHSLAHARPFSLRSGCELRPAKVRWQWLGTDEDRDIAAMTPDTALDLFHQVVNRAADGGLPVGPDHWQSITVTPNPELAKAIRQTYPEVE